MDKKDLKILSALDKNPRASFNQIGKSARVGKETAQYRFKQLINKKILTNFFAYIDTSKLGYQTNKILIKYKSVAKETQKRIINFVKKSKVVAWTGLSEGAWDLIITTSSSSSQEFVNFFNNFFNQFGSHFREKQVLIPVDNPIFNDKYLTGGKLIYKKNLSFHSEKINLDKKDKQILLAISSNSRTPFTEIGKKVNLTYWAVAQRYKKLISKGVIVLLKPRIDFRKLGYSYYHLFVELDNEKTREKLISYYTQHKDCVIIMNHVGSYSLHLEFVIKKDEMAHVIMDLREKFGKDILRYEPLLIVEEYVMNILR